MTQWNRNPKNGDYVVVNGSPESTNDLKVPAYMRLKTGRGKWLYAKSKSFGSMIGDVKKLPARKNEAVLERLTEQALQPMIDDGRAQSVTVHMVDGDRDGRLLSISIVDRQNENQEFAFSPIGGD